MENFLVSVQSPGLFITYPYLCLFCLCLTASVCVVVYLCLSLDAFGVYLKTLILRASSIFLSLQPRRREEEESPPMTTHDDEENEKEEKEEVEEEMLEMATTGESPSIGDRLRDQHNRLYRGYCLRCPGTRHTLSACMSLSDGLCMSQSDSVCLYVPLYVSISLCLFLCLSTCLIQSL